MNEDSMKFIVACICVVVFLWGYKEKDFDCIKSPSAWIYRIAYGLMLVEGILFITVNLLQLWTP